MKKIIPKQISLIFLFCSSIFIELFGQGQANVWYFGDNIGLDFNTSPPTVLRGMTPVDGNTNIMESAASISDASGKFLFGTNGKDIYSADRQIRGALPYTFNAFSVAQGALIIPRPGSTTDYYLSSISYTGCSSANPAAYQTITVSGTTGNNITIGATTYLSDNGNGITQGQMVLPRTDIAGNLTGDFWLVHHEWNSNNFIIYSVSSAGITYVKKVSAGVVVNGECSDVTAFFKANACYNQFVYNFGGSTYLFDFDTRTAAITNRNSVNIPEAYGVEFSKNGKWVYVCSGTFTQTPTVYKIPVTPGGVTGSTLGSATPIGNPYGNIRGGCLQMGPDGQIYAASFSSWFGTPRTDWIGVVKDPENGGGFTQQYLETTNAQLGMGLPSFITSLVANKVSLDIEGVSSSQASPCVNTPTKLQVNLNGTIVGAVNWRFFLPGNTGTTPDATATGNPITHTYTGLGAHRTVVSVTDACGRNINMEFPTTTVPFQNADATVSASCPKVLTGSGSTSGNYKWYSSNPSSGGTILGIGATYNFAGTNGGSIWVEPAGSVNVVTTSDNRTSSGWGTAAGNTTLTIPTGLSSITEFKIGYYSHSTAISGSFSAELRDANNVKIGSTVSKVISHPSGGINTTATLSPTDWTVTSGSYTVILTATPSGASIGSLSSNSYSANGVSISGGQTHAYTIQTSNETTILSCKTGKSISIPSCCSPSVGTPSAISVSSGTEPTCQLTNATTTTTYSTTATNATGYNWSLSNASAGSINATTGVMTWSNGFSGSVDILVTAAGCNGPSSQVKRTVNITSLPSAPAAITFTSPVCAGAINQAVSVVAVTGATSYTWSYTGTGATFAGTGNSTTVNFSSTATGGNITVTANNTCGSSAASPTKAVVLNDKPAAPGAITFSSPVCAGATAQAVSVTAVSGATSYTWSYSGAGATFAGTTNSTTVSFSSTATAGNITVTATNTCGTSAASPTKAVVVNDKPAAPGAITFSSPVCAGATSQAVSVNAVSGATSYTWTYSGTGATFAGTGNSTTVNFSSTATGGNITVTATNTCGTSSASPAMPVVVNSTPSAPGAITFSSPVCAGATSQAVSVTAVSGATSYTWSYSGTGATFAGTGNSTTVNFSSNATGGNITVTATSTCGTSLASPAKTVVLNTIPAAPGAITFSSPVCVGATSQPVSVNAVSGATSYTWSYTGNGATFAGTTNSTTVNFSSTATAGNIKVTATNTCGTSSSSPALAVVVNDKPTQPSIITGETNPCIGSQPYSVTSATNATSYTWAVSGGGTLGTSTTNSTSVTWTTAGGPYNLTITPNNSCGSGTSRNLSITVKSQAGAVIGAVTGSNSVCVEQTGSTYQLNGGIPTGVTGIKWSVTGGSIVGADDQTSVTISWGSAAGVFKVSCTPRNDCGNGSPSELNVTVNGKPNITNTDLIQTICSDNNSSAITLLSDIPNANFTWTASSPNGITGFSPSGSGNITAQKLTNPSINQGKVDYVVTVTGPSPTSCAGTATKTFVVNVDAVPTVDDITPPSAICSGLTTNIPLSANIVSSTLNWSVVSSSGASGASTGTGNSISQILSTTGLSAGTVVYSVSAKSGNCTGAAKTVSQTVNPGTSITVQPLPATVCVGEGFTLKATATGLPTLSYKWQKNGIDLVPSELNSTLTRTSAQSSDAGDYTVVIVSSGATGSCATATSNIAKVIVNGVSLANTEPSDQGTCAGGDVIFSVSDAKGSNGTSSSLSYQWYKNGVLISIGGNASTFPVPSSTVSQNGDKYKVEIRDNDLCPLVSREAILTVNTNTTTNSFRTLLPYYCEGDDVTFTAQVGGTPPFDYTLTKGGVTVPGGTKTGQASGNYSFTLNDVLVGTNDGVYELKVSSGCGAADEVKDTLVIGKVVLGNLLSEIACEGESKSFNLSTVGSSNELSYQWYKDNQPVNDGFNITGATTASLQLSNLTMSDSGAVYKVLVKANGICDMTSNDARLEVRRGTKITQQPTPPLPVPCEGTAFTLQAKASGYGLSYQWSKDGANVGGNSPTYTIASSTAADSGIYNLTVTGYCDLPAVSNNVRVKISPTPSQPVFSTPLTSPLATCSPVQDLLINPVPTGVISWEVDNGASIANNNSTSNQITNMSPGKSYTVKVLVSSGNCAPKSATTLIDRAGEITLALPTSTLNTCEGNTLTLTATASGAGIGTITGYNWYKVPAVLLSTTNSITYSKPAADASSDQGQYYVEAISSSCPTSPIPSNISTVKISAKPSVQVLTGDLVCEGNAAKVMVSASEPNVTYQAIIGNTPLGTPTFGNGQDLTIGIGANRLSVGLNNITVKALSEGCPALDLGPAEVQVVGKPVALIGNGEPTFELVEPKPFTLDGTGSSPSSISFAWFSDDDFANKSITDAFSSSTQAMVQAIKTKFRLFVTLTSPLACRDTAEVEVIQNIRLIVPNTFTPNGDGNHDIFEIFNLQYFKNATVEIFNQWGERVFKSEPGYPTPWDGKRGGQDLAESTYYYMIDLKEKGFNNQSGYLTLVR